MLQASKRKIETTKRAGSQGKVGVIVSAFNEEICENLLKGCLKTLKKCGYDEKSVSVHHVAGAYEIPLMSQQVLKKKNYSGVITLGCVIRGDTPHFEYICEAVSNGCMRVQLDLGKPIAFGVITVNNEEQAIERSQPNEYNKGREAALALLETLTALKVA